MTAETFLQTLRDRPGMIMMRGDHPLHRLQAFVEGMRWQQSLESSDEQMTIALSLLSELPAEIADVGAKTGDSVGWFDKLLERNGHDEQRAFADAMKVLILLARKRGVL